MRDQIRALVLERDFEALLALAERDRKVLSAILSFTYQPEGLLRWRAVEGLGIAAGRVADRDPEFVRGIVRRLFWSLSDESGSVGWSAPEAIGEIVANRPRLFADYAPMVVSLFETLEESYFRPGILWAIGRIATGSPDLVRDAVGPAVAFLSDPDPQVRGLAAWCLGHLGAPEAADALQPLFPDEHTIQLYEDGVLRTATVGELARRSAVALSSQAER